MKANYKDRNLQSQDFDDDEDDYDYLEKEIKKAVSEAKAVFKHKSAEEIKELWKKDSSRKELILKLLNEKFNNQNKKIIYIKNKFEIKDIKKSVFERLFLYLCSKLAKSQKMSANIS